MHRRGDDVVGEAGTFPKLRAGGRIIAAHALGRADDDLRLAFVLDHERRGPGGLFIARNFPELLSGAFVKGVEVRVSFVIPANNEPVAVEHGRTAFAVGVERVHPAKVLRPFQIARQIEAIETARTEEDVNVLAVGHG